MDSSSQYESWNQMAELQPYVLLANDMTTVN